MHLKITLLFLLVCVAFASNATHIVGGEFEITHLNGDTYQFRQIQYFDKVNGSPGAKDQEIRASIFRKRDNLFVRSVTMPLREEGLVPYTNPACTNDRLVTLRLVYSSQVTLDPDLFSDPQGYYMVWERCCRNVTITNIVKPDETGQTFYIEFPAIRKDGKEFIDSSPQLFPPLSDYACVNRFYYVDFMGYDPDGDSLVYSLTTPLNTHEFTALPDPTPVPHPPVVWVAGISDNYQIPGNPTLQVDSKGFLTVTPSEEGLFVFSVKCEEYRDGVKIGEVRRDFQLLVIDCPDPGTPPEIMVKAPGSNEYQSSIGLVKLKNTDSKCFDFIVKDRDSNELISLIAQPVNFQENLGSILSVKSGSISSPDDSLKVQLCLPDCPYLQNVPFMIDVIARDNSCPLPLADTLRLSIAVEPPLNQPPHFVQPGQKVITATYQEGSIINFDLKAVDPDLDSLLLDIEGVGFGLDTFGITVDTMYNADGSVNLHVNWDTDCQKYPFGLKNIFQLKFYVDDDDQCGLDNRDSVIYNIKINLPENNPPIVTINGNSEDQKDTVRIEDMLNFQVSATDADATDQLYLKAVFPDYNPGKYGMSFSDMTGNSSITGTFNWDVLCSSVNLGLKKDFLVYFIAEDGDKCKVNNADTLETLITVLPPLNDPPQLSLESDPRSDDADTIVVDAGDLVDLKFLGFDPNQDSIALGIIKGNEFVDRLGVHFEPASGVGNLSTPLNWQTDCTLLGASNSDSVYTFTFTLKDFKCLVPQSDTLTLKIAIRDLPVDYSFLPPNVFTPNHDKWNEYYYIDNMPADNCRSRFEEIIICNRWGKEVFSSNDRNFKWSGEELSPGTYFYALHFTDRIFKGTIALLR